MVLNIPRLLPFHIWAEPEFWAEPELWKKYGGGGPFTHHPQEQFQWFLTLRDERIKTDPYMTQLRRKWELDTLGYTVLKNLYTDSEDSRRDL